MSELENPATSLDEWWQGMQAQLAERRQWWSEHGIGRGLREKRWQKARRLLPRDLSLDEIAAIEPAVGWAQERLEQCAECSPNGGACDVEFAQSVEKGRLPVWNNEKRDIDFVWCEAHMEHVLRQRLSGFGVPPRLLGARLENFDGHDQLRASVGRYLDKFSKLGPESYHFVGGQGCGKSHLAAAVVRELARRKLVNTVFFAFVPTLLEQMRQAMDSSGDAREELRHRLLLSDFLVLDDLGAERPSEWVREQMGIIIHERWAAMLPILVTSNLTLDHYQDVLGPRAFSRLRAMTPYVRQIDGPDRRAP